MVIEALKLLASVAGSSLRARVAEFALAGVAAGFFLVALILGSVAVHQVLVEAVGRPAATGIMAAVYLSFALIALLVAANIRRRRRRMVRRADLATALPRTTPALMVVAMLAGAMFGRPSRRR